MHQPHLGGFALPAPDRAGLAARYAALDAMLNAGDWSGGLPPWEWRVC